MKKNISFKSVKNILLGLALTAPLAAGNAMAYTSAYKSCDPCASITCNPCDAVGCQPKKSLWDFGGWVDVGLYGNEYGQQNVYYASNLNGYSGNTELLQNAHQSDFQANQVWVYGQKKLSKRGFDVGGRVDFAYGTDALYLQSENLEYSYDKNGGNDRWQHGDYYTALAQAYAEVGYNGLSVKAGKFLSPLGHESIMSPDRFFYSLSYAYAINPSTLTGAVATWDMNDKLSVFGGWVCGEDRTFEHEDDNAFIGGVKWRHNKHLSVSYAFIVGEERPWHNWRDNDHEYFVHSFVVNFKPTKRWDYTFEWTLRNENDTSTTWGPVQKWGGYGINNELIYKLNKRWSLGVRAEWMHVYGNRTTGARNTLPGVGPNDDAFAVTLGANWKPTKWFTLKPEVRYDVLDNTRLFNMTKSNWQGGKQNQLSGGVSAVVKF